MRKENRGACEHPHRVTRKLLDILEIVESMGIKKSTVWLWIRKGRLKGHKVGRKYYVSSEDLKRYIESGPSPVAK